MSLDQARAEEWYVAGSDTHATPEESYDRDWAEAVVEHALRALAAEFEERGKGLQLARLREFLSWDHAEPEVAAPSSAA